jgi:enamine deaminase RidA (YjgF/YER057c/UK114 family)
MCAGRRAAIVAAMETTTALRINPTTWNTGLRFDQAQLRPAPQQLLTLAGQGPLSADGELLHAGDPAAQLGAAMDNVEGLLAAGGMDLRDVLHMTIYVTDVGAALAGYAAVTDRLDSLGATPPATLVEVTQLAVPGMTCEIQASAGR